MFELESIAIQLVLRPPFAAGFYCARKLSSQNQTRSVRYYHGLKDVGHKKPASRALASRSVRPRAGQARRPPASTMELRAQRLLQGLREDRRRLFPVGLLGLDVGVLEQAHIASRERDLDLGAADPRRLLLRVVVRDASHGFPATRIPKTSQCRA